MAGRLVLPRSLILLLRLKSDPADGAGVVLTEPWLDAPSVEKVLAARQLSCLLDLLARLEAN